MPILYRRDAFLLLPLHTRKEVMRNAQSNKKDDYLAHNRRATVDAC